MKRAYAILLLGLAAFLCLQAAVFHTRAYAYWVNPSSAAGYVETVLDHEWKRVKHEPNQVVAIGDSRMALVAKSAAQFAKGTGFEYASVSVAGAPPRCWYYMLRDLDPQANKYRAIVIGLESYNDDETFEDISNRESDLNYLAARLRVSDLPEFASSHTLPQRRLRAAAGIALRGLLYKPDVLDFLNDPQKRVFEVQRSWRDSYHWFYDFRTDDKNLSGLQVDWEHKTMITPPGVSPEMAQLLKVLWLAPLPVDKGARSKYMKYWLGRIYDLYKGSQTKLIFLRVPRGAWIRPDLPPTNPNSSVHQLEKYPNVRVLPEHLFDELETPERFHDEYHLNQGGLDRFTEIVVQEVPKVLAR